jgi:hypothetical protein
VSTGGARRGRRDNGLDAADFAAAGDVDPRVGEHLLDVLALDGIAAYLQPSADLNPILRATTYPGRPTDRLYVDRTHLTEAKATMNRLTDGVSPIPPAGRGDSRPEAGGSQRDVDAEWAKIVAGFDQAMDPTAAPPWPAAETLAVDPTRPPDPPGTDPQSTDPHSTDPHSTDPHSTDPQSPEGPKPLQSATDFSGITMNRRRTDNPEPSLIDGLDTFGADVDDEDDERYIPPPPPPLPHISKYAIAGVLGIIVGFVLFLRPTLLPVDRNLATLLGFSAVIAGAVTLVWRLRSGDEDDDDFDDGAVV